MYIVIILTVLIIYYLSSTENRQSMQKECLVMFPFYYIDINVTTDCTGVLLDNLRLITGGI